jgi:hypothetical protein
MIIRRHWLCQGHGVFAKNLGTKQAVIHQPYMIDVKYAVCVHVLNALTILAVQLPDVAAPLSHVTWS